MKLYNYFQICVIAQLAITSAASATSAVDWEYDTEASPSSVPSISVAPSVSNMPSVIADIDLGTAGNYVILAKSGITTIPSSLITGNIAVSPIQGAAMTGFLPTYPDGTKATSDQVSGFLYGADYLDPTPGILTTSVSDMETAYADAASRPNPDAARINLKGGSLSGDTMTPGVYTFSSAVSIVDDIFFCGGENDVFIIQTAQTFYVASDKKVILACGAKAENIFWQVAEAVTVGTGAHMEGIILGFTGVTFNTGSSLNGRIYAQTMVALQKATITQPDF
jgi:hypothetical protein